MRIVQCICLGMLLFCVGCSNTDKKKSKAKGAVISRLTPEGAGQTMKLLPVYFGLKNALVASDAAKTAEQSILLAKGIENVISFLETDSVDKQMLRPYLDTILLQTRVVSAVQDPTCERQRLAFSDLSTAMYGMLKSIDLTGGGIYKQYCPMAFNDKGAFWLSEEEEIKNPYFGKKMLECGEVQESF